MAMLATLEGTETTGTDEYILSRMFSPNDGLGVELMGVEVWNMAKRKAATAARKVLKAKRLFIVPEIIYCDPTPCRDDLAGVLFGLDENYCNELLGFSLTRQLKKATSGVAKAATSVAKAVSNAPKEIAKSVNPINVAKKSARTAWKLAKKYTKPSQALKLSLSPTEQLKVVSSGDITGISQAVTKQAAKISPDLMPYEVTKKVAKKVASTTQPTRQLYKIAEKSVRIADVPSPGGIYEQTQKADPEIRYITQYVNTPSGGGETLPEETTTETGVFDWSGLLNWKTLAVGGIIAYFVFGRGKRGKRK